MGKVRISILTDNAAGPKFLAAHGFSIYIEADIKVLFDTGPDNTFIENAQRLGIDLKPDYIVLSHGHWDHGNGLSFAPASKLVYHPSCFIKRFSKIKDIYVGLAMDEKELTEKFIMQPMAAPLKLSDDITYITSIPRWSDFEAKHTDFIDSFGADDFIPDDSALTINSTDGLIVISGCAHAGICNTIEYAKEVTGKNTIAAVFGGFHLKSAGKPTMKTIEYLEKNMITKVFPSHCTSLPALVEFYKAFRIMQVLSGNYYNFS
jgi:7,8-dihydropterin-6-yl-methyl-4-(beta-D-ribofuranosyl)aminobenzene 5'-phosphate synthase